MMQNSQPYIITDDFTVFESLFPMPDILRNELQYIQNKIHNHQNTTVYNKLMKLKKKYPDNAHLLCDIATYYGVRGNNNKAIELYKEVIKKYPEYTFAYINLAKTYIDDKDFDTALIYLGKDCKIENLFPGRKEFYIGELTSYLNVCFSYFLFQADFDNAENIIEQLEATDPEDEQIEAYKQLLSLSRTVPDIENDHDMFDEDDEEDIEIPPLPEFNIPIICELFEFGSEIPINLLNNILKQDRKLLIADLETVLDYALEHSDFFIEHIFHEKRNSFVLHTFILLGELKAKECLNKCIDFFNIDLYSLDYWLGDHSTETLWQVFYNFDIDLLFLKDYIIENYKKNTLFIATSDCILCNTGLLKPETKLLLSVVYKEILEYIDSLDPEKDFINKEYNAMIVASCINLKFKNLLPLIEHIYSDKKADESFCGTIADITRKFTGSRNAYIPKLRSISEIYSYFEKYNEMSFIDDDDNFRFNCNDFSEEENETPYLPPFETLNKTKVGRNDPCPCGSGKKYKKCCMNKTDL